MGLCAPTEEICIPHELLAAIPALTRTDQRPAVRGSRNTSPHADDRDERGKLREK